MLRQNCISPLPLQLISICWLLFSTIVFAAEPWADAREHHLNKSYALAVEGYQKVLDSEAALLDEAELSRLQFWIADATWRNLASTNQRDLTVFEAPEQQLEALLATIEKGEKPYPQLWADIHTSLGELAFRLRSDAKGSRHLELAMDWWAASADIELARIKYLQLIRTWAQPLQGFGNRVRNTYIRQNLDISRLDDALLIAEKPSDHAWLQYIIALNCSSQSYQSNVIALRTANAFAEATAIANEGEPWFIQALQSYAQWCMQAGHLYFDDKGNLQREPDFVKALALTERLPADSAKSIRQSILDKQLSVNLSFQYRPGDPIDLELGWRNLPGFELSIYPVSLTRDIVTPRPQKQRVVWLDEMNLNTREPVYQKTFNQQPKRPHYPISESFRLDQQLEPGAYIVEVKQGDTTDRDIILITDIIALTQSTEDQLNVFIADAVSGAPIPNATVRIITQHYDRQQKLNVYKSNEMQTNESGLAVFRLEQEEDQRSTSLAVFAEVEGRQAWVDNIYTRSFGHKQDGELLAYIYAEKPLYRPGDTAQSKIIMRTRTAEGYSIPTDRAVKYRMVDSQGAEIAQGQLTFNSFGSASISTELTNAAPLGMYRLELRTLEDQWIASEQMFRVEEFKLPEFEVSISLDGDKLYRLGDTVSGTIQADYYFGGGVAGAEVELRIDQASYSHIVFPMPRHFAKEDDPFAAEGFAGRSSMPQHQAGRKTIQQVTLKTDAAGRASFSFNTPEFSENDYTYTITARVRDESRREVEARQSVKVTRQSYFVAMQAERNIVRPGESAEVSVRVEDANGNGLKQQGTVRITREVWRERWLDPRGKEISGRDVHELTSKPRGLFGPRYSMDDFRLIQEGYESVPVETITLSSDSNGDAMLRFTMPEAGYYKLRWLSEDTNGMPITEETILWASDGSIADLGYRTDNLRIVADTTEVAVGYALNLLILANESGRTVLFTQYAEDIINTEIIRMDGSAKLVRIAINEAHAPNFWIDATSILDHSVYSDSASIEASILSKQLQVAIATDQAAYAPGENAKATITSSNYLDETVNAELSLAAIDKAVYAIQPSLRAEIFDFFFARQRNNRLRQSTSINQRSFYEPTPDQEVVVVYGGVSKASGGAEMRSLAMRSDPFAASELVFEDITSAESQPEIALREDFRSSLIWLPEIITVDGKTTVDIPLADSLTTWQINAVAISEDGSVGEAETTIVSRLPLIARLQTPRFLTAGDEAIITGVLNNNTDQKLTVAASLEIDGLELLAENAQSIEVPAQSSAKVEWGVQATEPGEASITLTASSERFGDAMRLNVPVQPHGIEQFLGASGKLVAGTEEIQIDLPEYREGSMLAKLMVTPSLAVQMVDALPYLIHYPYGCTEQTMSRFLPALAVKRVLTELGLSAEAIEARIFSKTEGTDTEESPSFENLEQVITDGLDRLYDFQKPDGSWGWWKDSPSNAFMTAYVVWGLEIGRQISADIDTKRLRTAREWLTRQVVNSSMAADTRVWVLHALSANRSLKPSKEEATAFLELMRDRDALNSYGRALLAISASNYGFEDDARLLAENLRNGIQISRKTSDSDLQNPDDKRLTTSSETALAHWGADGMHWRWSEGGVEATAFGLMALLEVDPNNRLVEPVLNWLLANRTGNRWADTRETSITLLALTNYLLNSTELEQDGAFRVTLDGEVVSEKSLSSEQVLERNISITLPVEKLGTGKHKLKIERTDGSEQALYYQLGFRYFSEEEPIASAGSGLFIKRSYYRIHNAPTLLKGFVEQKELLADGLEVTSGDRIEVVLQVEAKNHLEFLMLEDMKPAGFESTRLRSGEPIRIRGIRREARDSLDEERRYLGASHYVHQELRNNRTAFFVDKLAEGFWEIRYRLRAETPGQFHALPAMAEAMYVPQISGNSRELRVKVSDAIAD